MVVMFSCIAYNLGLSLAGVFGFIIDPQKGTAVSFPEQL
jgi:hypothetical protein